MIEVWKGFIIQHDDGTGERRFSLLAIPDIIWIESDIAAFCDIPGRSWLRVLWVGHVAGGLVSYGDRVESCQDSVDDNRERGIKDMQDIHGRLDEKEEHAEDGDHEVEVGDAERERTRHRSAGGHQEPEAHRRRFSCLYYIETYNGDHARGVSYDLKLAKA